MSLFNDICEAVAINYRDQNRYEKYIKLITEKYEVGKFIKEISISNGIECIILGKTNLTNYKNQYLYLVVNYNKSSRDKSGFITHFGFSEIKNDNIKVLGDFNNPNFEFESTGGRLLKIPDDFVKFEHIMALICNIGKVQFRNIKGNELTSIPKDENIVSSIDEKFDLVTQLIRMVFTKNLNGLIITGDPGMGKTYSLLEILKDLNLEDGTDYYYVQGAKITLTKFYGIMFENKEKILIFDDSDSVILNDDGVNMLKAALDSNPRREITYESPVISNLGLPSKFQFTGKGVFISNLPMSSINSALKSRSIVMDLHFTREEKLDRIKSLVYKALPELILGGTEESNKIQRDEIIEFLNDFIDRYPNKPENLDIRTYNKLLEIRNSSPDFKMFKKIATNQLLQS